MSCRYSSYVNPYFIVSKRSSLVHLASIKNLCFDKTYTNGGTGGVYVISEKVCYQVGQDDRIIAQRAISWVYIYTKSQDQVTITEIFNVLKSMVEKLSGTVWKPQHFIVDFDQDKYFFTNILFFF